MPHSDGALVPAARPLILHLSDAMRLRALLTAKEVQRLLALPPMADATTLQQVEELARELLVAIDVDYRRFASAGLEGVQLVSAQGSCPQSRLILAACGAVLANTLADYNERGPVSTEPGAVFLHCALTAHWSGHLRETLAPLRAGFDRALEEGSPATAGLCSRTWCAHLLVGGAALNRVDGDIARDEYTLARLEQAGPLASLRGYRRFIGALIGMTAGDTPVSTALPPSRALAEDLVLRAQLGLHFGQTSQALTDIRAAEPLVQTFRGTVWEALFNYTSSLVFIAAHPSQDRGTQRRLMREVKVNQRRLRRWAVNAPENLSHRWHLVEAERLRLAERDQQAQLAYTRAIELAYEHRYVQDEALAWELAGRHHLSRGRLDAAKAHIRSAQSVYRKWGATAKVDQIESRFGEILPTLDPFLATGGSTHDRLNIGLLAVLRASQSVSTQVDLHGLLEELTRSAVKTAGAERGLLVLGSPVDLVVHTRTEKSDGPGEPMTPVPLEQCMDLSGGIVLRVAATMEPVVLGDAATEGPFVDDLYVAARRPRSVLCLPILHHGALTGVLYLEHNAAVGVFTRKRVQALELLIAQAAISIEIAKLYDELSASEEKHRLIVFNAMDGIFQATADGRLLSANPAMARLLMYEGEAQLIEEVSDLRTQVFTDSDLFDGVPLTGFETRFRRRDGRPVWVAVNLRGIRDEAGTVSYFEGSVRDVHRDKLARKQMQRAEKLAALGQLVAGVAHEINNPNNFVFFNLPILRQYLDELRPLLDPIAAEQPDLEICGLPYDEFVEDTYRLLDNMQHGSSRITQIVKGLKSYARSQDTEVKRLEALEPLVQRVAALLGKQIGKTVARFEIEVEPDLPQVWMNAGSIEQVLVNLVINASHAVDGGDSEVRIVAVADEQTDQVEIRVQDNGAGIATDVLDQIFEPFFTTKGGEEGTGLGLAISREILEDHGGTITVESEPGVGTRFTVRLPMGEA